MEIQLKALSLYIIIKNVFSFPHKNSTVIQLHNEVNENSF